MSWRVPLVQHPAHGRNSGAPGRSRLSAAAGAAMGTRRAQTAAHLASARHDPARRGAAHFPLGGGTLPARTQPRLPRHRTDRGGRLHPPFRLKPERAHPFPLVRHRRRLRASRCPGRCAKRQLTSRPCPRARRGGVCRCAGAGANPCPAHLRQTSADRPR